MSVADSAPTIPIGVILPFAGLNVSEGWLPGDGGVYDPVEYPKLFQTIGTIFGGTSVAPLLPDLVNRYPVGLNGVNPIGTVTPASFSATETFTIAPNNMPSLTLQPAQADLTFAATLAFGAPADYLNQGPADGAFVVGDSTLSPNVSIQVTGPEVEYVNFTGVTPVSSPLTASVVQYAGYSMLYIIKAGGF